MHFIPSSALPLLASIRFLHSALDIWGLVVLCYCRCLAVPLASAQQIPEAPLSCDHKDVLKCPMSQEGKITPNKEPLGRKGESKAFYVEHNV